MKRSGIDFHYVHNMVAVKWFDYRRVTVVGTCLEECNEGSTVTSRVKGQSTKISVPCPEIVKDCNPGKGGNDLFNQKTAAYKLDLKSSGGRYYLRMFFNLMDISVVNLHTI